MRWWAWPIVLLVSWLVGAVLGVLSVIWMDEFVTDLEKDRSHWRNQAKLVKGGAR